MDFAHFKKPLHLSSLLPRPSEGGHLPSASPCLSSTSQGRPRAAGGPQRLFVSLFTSWRAPESLFTDCSNLPLFPPLLSLAVSFSFRDARRATLTDLGQGRSHALLRAINLRGGGSRNFLRLTRSVFRRPIPTQMMNTTSFQISHPLSAAPFVRQMMISKHELM